MAKNQTLELSILIGGHVDNSLTQAVKSANTQLSSMANGASKLAANIAKVTVGIASGITAGLVDATKEAVAFESEMLDVTKYVGGLTDANGKVKTDAYAEMSKDILDLSTQIPYTAKELTRLAAAAGQSGKSMDDLISGGFLKDVAEMGTAMDISADQAGDWAAKWEVAFNMNHDQVMELADQINYLGAHYATTAAEIAQTVNDTGSLGQIAGMDVQSTAALSTALLAMGVDSGKVATSIRRMYTNLSMGSKATDAQSAAFEQLGFTAEQFAKDMQKDAPAALKSLFTAIGTQPKDKQVGYLKTLLGQWAIESGAKLTGNLDLFVKTLDDVGDASKYNGSMENILKVFLMAFPEWLACIFMVVGLVVTALAAVRLGYGLVVAKTVYKWIVNAEEKFGSGAGAEKKAHVIAVLRGYTPDWLDWAINERTLDWIVQLVFDFTKKKLEDYMAKKSAETTTVAHFGNVGENKRND